MQAEESSNYSDINLSDDCNSQCESPCTNPEHFECGILGEIIKNADDNEGDVLNKLFAGGKPKSKIGMFMKAAKASPKKEPPKTSSSFDVHKKPFTPSKEAQMQ